MRSYWLRFFALTIFIHLVIDLFTYRLMNTTILIQPNRSKENPIKNRAKTRVKSQTVKTLFQVCRDLHVYISTLLFSLLMFFSITGITLNHLEWLPKDSAAKAQEITLPESMAASLAKQPESQLAAVEEYLVKHYGLPKARSIDFDRELGEINYDFPLPAGFAFALVDIETATIIVESERQHFWLLMNDLHKGRHTGEVWSWLIDLSAGFMMFFALTGLVILFQQKRRKRAGMVLTLAGTLTPLLLYWLWVPSV